MESWWLLQSSTCVNAQRQSSFTQMHQHNEPSSKTMAINLNLVKYDCVIHHQGETKLNLMCSSKDFKGTFHHLDWREKRWMNVTTHTHTYTQTKGWQERGEWIQLFLWNTSSITVIAHSHRQFCSFVWWLFSSELTLCLEDDNCGSDVSLLPWITGSCGNSTDQTEQVGSFNLLNGK